ncbi:MAG TPA: orotidine-5'-phosphate decarboxylase [Alphaproteobacteria bacterium]|nr:orotidine-5'-phosphate decarboxylase [Alphaproteobacteria bacterium]
MSSPRLFIALDTTDRVRAQGLARAIGNRAGIKLGLEFFAANGPAGVERVRQPDQRLFLDLKFHDIPNTVAGAVRAAAALAPDLLTLHAAGGSAMLRAARDAAAGASTPPILLAVTVLTSFKEAGLAETGQRGPLGDQALRLARLARDAGLKGAVCSAHEIGSLKAELGPHFRLAVPGLRPAGASMDDQARVMTPAEAVRAGADWLVIGRPVTAAPDPDAALARILEEMEEAGP